MKLLTVPDRSNLYETNYITMRTKKQRNKQDYLKVFFIIFRKLYKYIALN